MCTRAGCYRLARLAVQFGAEMDMAKLVAILARDCPCWNSNSRKYEPRCGARYADADVTAPKIERHGPYAKPAPAGPPPTIANSRQNGVVALFVECAGLYCHHKKRFTFEELGLSDNVVFIEIPR